MVVLQLLFTYAPPLQELFGTQGVPLYVWPRLFAGGLAFFALVELEKAILRATRGSARAAAVPA